VSFLFGVHSENMPTVEEFCDAVIRPTRDVAALQWFSLPDSE
jgi:hypothetical protein